MDTVEFQTTVKDGKIEIPAEYRDQLPEQVRVILLAPASDPEAAGYIDQLLANPLPAPGFAPFKRDELYER